VHSIDRTVESIVKHLAAAGSQVSQVDVDRLRKLLLSPQGALEHANAMASKKTFPAKTHNLQSANTSGSYFTTTPNADGDRSFMQINACIADYGNDYSIGYRTEQTGNQITVYSEVFLFQYICYGYPALSSIAVTCTTPADCAIVSGIPDAPPGYRVK
jgi:hypothetical protein